MCKTNYRYLDYNNLVEKQEDCKECGYIDKNGTPSLNLYAYIKEVVSDTPCCDGSKRDKCDKPCKDFFIHKSFFQPTPANRLTEQDNFDLLSIIVCILVEDCNFEENYLYDKYCKCKGGCCTKTIQLPLKYLSPPQTRGCKDKKGDILSLYAVIYDLTVQTCENIKKKIV